MKKVEAVLFDKDRKYLDDEEFLGSLDPSIRDHVIDLLEYPENWGALALSLPATLIEPVESFLRAESGRPTVSTEAAARLVSVVRQVVQVGKRIREQADLDLDRAAVDPQMIRYLCSELSESWTEWIVQFSAVLAYSFLPAERRRRQKRSERTSVWAGKPRPAARKVDHAELVEALKRSKSNGYSRSRARSIEKDRLMRALSVSDRTVRAALDRACDEVPGWETSNKKTGN